jgi:hypothetical protein
MLISIHADNNFGNCFVYQRYTKQFLTAMCAIISPNGRLPTTLRRALARRNVAERSERMRAQRSPRAHGISWPERGQACYALYFLFFKIISTPNAQRARRGHGKHFFLDYSLSSIFLNFDNS